ncbi:hypothetical protein SAMN05216597_4834 [Pseudomonas cannabina]|nr:hypothetical protein SAMN05216597_4834 [Pseudomonas cannabina]
MAAGAETQTSPVKPGADILTCNVPSTCQTTPYVAAGSDKVDALTFASPIRT